MTVSTDFSPADFSTTNFTPSQALSQTYSPLPQGYELKLESSSDFEHHAATRPLPEPSLLPKKENPLDRIILLDSVGKGSYGTVYRAFHKYENRLVAVKILDRADALENSKILTEIHAMESGSPHIVACSESFFWDKQLWLVIDFMDLGDLELICNEKSLAPTEEEVAVIMQSCLIGLVDLHKLNIIHRDLKPANILLNSEGQIKLADFGESSVMLSKNSVRSTVAGTPAFMPPEMKSWNPTYSFEVDIFCLGMTAWALRFGAPPRVLTNIATFTWTALSISEEFKSFLLGCLAKDPNARLSAAQLLQHSFVMKSCGDLSNLIARVVEYKKQHTDQDEYPNFPLDVDDDRICFFISPKICKSYPGLRKISDNPDLFIVYDFLDKDECKVLRGKGRKMVPSKVAKRLDAYAKNVDTNRRDAKETLLEQPDVPDTIRNKMLKLLNRPLEEFEPLKISFYGPDGKFCRHVDGGHRILTLIMYLNDIPVGGQTRFFTSDSNYIDIQPREGMAVVFAPYKFPHEGLMVSEHKYIAQQWVENQSKFKRMHVMPTNSLLHQFNSPNLEKWTPIQFFKS